MKARFHTTWHPDHHRSFDPIKRMTMEKHNPLKRNMYLLLKTGDFPASHLSFQGVQMYIHGQNLRLPTNCLKQHVHPQEAKNPPNDNQSWKFLRVGFQVLSFKPNKRPRSPRIVVPFPGVEPGWWNPVGLKIDGWSYQPVTPSVKGLLAEKKEVPPRSKHHVSTETASVKQALTELWDMMKHTK